MPPMPVEVAQASRGTVQKVLPTVGSVRALREVKAGSRIAERVEKLLVDEGDPVKRGQVVCQLDTADTKLRILEAQAELARAEAQLANRVAGLRENEIKQAEAEVEEQKAKAKKLRLDAERVKKLFAKGVTSDAERDAVAAEYETAVARLHRFEAALALAREGTRKQLIDQARADVEYQRAQLALAKQRLADSTIVSPVDGTVVRKQVEIGSWTQVGGTVVDIIDTSVLRVHTRVTEKTIRLIKQGMPVTIRMDAHPGRLFDGVVHRVVPEADAASRSFPVQVNIERVRGEADPAKAKALVGSLVKPGMFARTSFVLAERLNVLMVPEDAVVYGRGLAMVFKAAPMPPPGAAGPSEGEAGVEPGAKQGAPPAMPPPGPMMIASRVVVETGARQEGRIEITQVVNGSLTSGDRVVVVGSENMRDGAPIIVVRGLPAQGKCPAAPARPPAGAPAASTPPATDAETGKAPRRR